MSVSDTKVSVISAGGWGTALAVVINRSGSKVTLYTANPNVLKSIKDKRANDVYLPDIFVEPHIHVTSDLAEACAAEIIVLSVPSQHLRSTCIALSDHLEVGKPLVVATKGIEKVSLALMSEVVTSVLPKNPVAILSGPNFAGEAARGLPTATTIACTDKYLANELIYSIGNKYFRPYYNSDVIGTQIGGAVKNVIAIACGIAIGYGFGENTRAALITRGISEMVRLAVAKEGKAETLMGLSGFGDLVLTCSSTTSRNMSLGIMIGEQKHAIKSILEGSQKKLAEGVTTAESVTELANKIGVSMPICRAVHAILSGELDIRSAVDLMLERQFVPEVMK